MTQSNKTREDKIAQLRKSYGVHGVHGNKFPWTTNIGILLDELDKANAEISKSSEALRVLQELTGSDNQVNPWLGVAAGTALLKNDSENLAKEREVSAELYRELDERNFNLPTASSTKALENARRLREGTK